MKYTYIIPIYLDTQSARNIVQKVGLAQKDTVHEVIYIERITQSVNNKKRDFS